MDASSFDKKGNRLNVLSPTASCGLTDAVTFPKLIHWNQVFVHCIQSNISNFCRNHGELYFFLCKWNEKLDDGWLQVLLTKGCYEKELANKMFYRKELNVGETILI
jgi:hypothetical protein